MLHERARCLPDRPDVVAKRTDFINKQPQLDAHRLVFVDESGFRLGGSPRFGWAPIGQDAVGLHVAGSWETMTIVGAIGLDGVRGFMTVDAGTSRDVFEAWIEQDLVKNLKQGDVVVMDNLAAHKGKRVRQLIEQAGASVLFTLPYSAELNPIKKMWAKLKDIIRRLDTLTRDAFNNAVTLQSISITDIRA